MAPTALDGAPHVFAEDRRSAMQDVTQWSLCSLHITAEIVHGGPRCLRRDVDLLLCVDHYLFQGAQTVNPSLQGYFGFPVILHVYMVLC